MSSGEGPERDVLDMWLVRPWAGDSYRDHSPEVSWRLRPWRHLSDGTVVEWDAGVTVAPTDGTGFGDSWNAAVDAVTGAITWPADAPLPPDDWAEKARRLILSQRRTYPGTVEVSA